MATKTVKAGDVKVTIEAPTEGMLEKARRAIGGAARGFVKIIARERKGRRKGRK